MFRRTRVRWSCSRKDANFSRRMAAGRHQRAIALGLLIACAPLSALAQPAQPETLELTEEPRPEFRRRLTWRWARFRDAEYLATAAAGVTLVGSLMIQPDEERWHGGILFDDDVRSELALSRHQDRRAAREISDVATISLVAYPILVDGGNGIIAGHGRLVAQRPLS